jgi:uncharacterized protein (TIGR02265 family)
MGYHSGEIMIQIKGSVLLSRLALIREIDPENGLARVLSRLSESDRTTLQNPLASSWYPFDLGKRLDEAVVEVLGGGRTEFFERLGAASAENNLGGVHKRFLTVGDPHAFLAKAPTIYAFYYDQGRREYEKTGPTEGVLTTHDASTFSAPDCATVAGWYRRALEMCGAKKPQVVEAECRARGGKVCRYRVSWS